MTQSTSEATGLARWLADNAAAAGWFVAIVFGAVAVYLYLENRKTQRELLATYMARHKDAMGYAEIMLEVQNKTEATAASMAQVVEGLAGLAERPRSSPDNRRKTQ